MRQTHCLKVKSARKGVYSGGFCVSDNVILTKTKLFAIRIIRLYKMLESEKKEYILSKQVLRSGTSIGANTREAMRGQSRLLLKT